MEKHLITLKDYIMWVDGNFYNVVWGESYQLCKLINGEKSLTVFGEIDLILNIDNVISVIECPEPPKKNNYESIFGDKLLTSIDEPHPEILIIK